MKHKDHIIIKKVLDYCVQCEEARAMFGDAFEQFCSVSVFQNSCCMCILQIGELCKILSDEFKEQHLEVPWRQWCGIRDVFAHQYSNIDYESAWATIQEDVTALKEFCQQQLDNVQEPAENASEQTQGQETM